MKVAVIEVKRTGEGDPLEFAVIVRVGDGETRHHVTMVRDTCERLTAGNDHKDDGDRSRLLQHRRSGGCVWADEAGERRGLPAPHDMGEKSGG